MIVRTILGDCEDEDSANWMANMIHFLSHLVPWSKLSNFEKATKISQQFPNEFCENPRGEPWCKLCAISVTCSSFYYVESHNKSSKHHDRVSYQPKQPKLFCKHGKNSVPFFMRIAEAFQGVNISLKKIQSKPLRKLFEFMGDPLPSESACRNNVD